MIRTRTILIVAATAACLIAAVAWAATPKGPGPVNLNPNVGSMNPSGATMPNPPGALTAAPPAPVPGPVVVPPFRPFYRRYGYGNYTYRYPRYYVVAEKRGPDITWSMYEWTNQVYARTVALEAERSATIKLNAALRKDVTALKDQAAELRASISREQDDEAKKELAVKLAEAEALIAQRESAVKPVVQWVWRGPMDSRRLDDFLRQLEYEAYLARIKAGAVPDATVPRMPRRSGY